jgi:hypothetical protein
MIKAKIRIKLLTIGKNDRKNTKTTVMKLKISRKYMHLYDIYFCRNIDVYVFMYICIYIYIYIYI